MSFNPFYIDVDPANNPFDQVIIAGDYIPGLPSVWSTKPSRKYKWDKKQGAGTAGDTITYRGIELVEFVIDVTFWEGPQVDAWDALYPKWTPDGKTGLDITHPTLDRLGVKSIVIVEFVQLFFRDAGAWGVQIGISEFRPPPPANITTTPDGSKTNNTKTDQPATAQTAQEKEIQNLLAEAKKP